MEYYEEMYQDFIKGYEAGSTTGEDAGVLVAKLAGFYPNYNLALAKAERAFAMVLRDEIMQTDESTGKAISATKAETLANASDEATAFKNARMHVQNIEMLIQAAKALQRGLIHEMTQSNLQ